MRRLTVATALALLNASALSPALATTWYVNNAVGLDSNNGQTLGTPFLTLQHAAGVTAPGDTVDILPGRGYGGGTNGTSPLVISTSGSGAGTAPGTPCASQITYQGYTGPFLATAAPLINTTVYPRPIISGTQASAVIYGANPLSCITINYLEIAGWTGALTWAGASQNAGLSGTGWQSNVYGGYGIAFTGTTGGLGSTSVHHLMVTNSLVHDFPGGCIAVNYGDYITIAGNSVYDCGNYSPFANSGISLYEMHNIDAGTGTKNLISANEVFNNAEYVPNNNTIAGTTTGTGTNATGATTVNVASSGTASAGDAVLDVTNGCVPPGALVATLASGSVTLSLPITCNITSATTLQFAVVTDGEGITIDNNTNSYSDSVAYVGRTLVTNNVVFGNGNCGLKAAPLSIDVDFTFNTVWDNQTFFNSSAGVAGANSELNDLGAVGLNVYNNAFVGLSLVPTLWDQSTSGSVFANNGVTGGNGAKAIPGSGNVTANPLFVNPSANAQVADFQLQSGSPLIEAGNGTFTRATDFMGHPGLVGLAYDIGAYEQPACATYGGAGTVRTLATLMATFANAGAGAITKQTMRDLIVTLACGTAASWGH